VAFGHLFFGLGITSRHAGSSAHLRRLRLSHSSVRIHVDMSRNPLQQTLDLEIVSRSSAAGYDPVSICALRWKQGGGLGGARSNVRSTSKAYPGRGRRGPASTLNTTARTCRAAGRVLDVEDPIPQGRSSSSRLARIEPAVRTTRPAHFQPSSAAGQESQLVAAQHPAGPDDRRQFTWKILRRRGRPRPDRVRTGPAFRLSIDEIDLRPALPILDAVMMQDRRRHPSPPVPSIAATARA